MKENSKKLDSQLSANALSDQEDFEAKHNLLGFFDLLLKIDIRNNPQNYKKESYENNRDTDHTD